MCAPKAPKAPDPKATAAAQTGTNVSTALANAQLGNVNQYGPDGSKVYTTSGSTSFTDPASGATYDIPQYNETVTLSGPQQAIKNANDSASLNLASLGADLSGKLSGQLTDNFELDNESTENRINELGRKRLDPLFADRRADLETKLSNQGIKLGSAAYDRAMGNFGQQENDAYNNLALTGRAQAAQEQLTEDNQRINQISALMSGGQVSQPTFGATSQPQIANVDYAGLVNTHYNQQANAAAQKNQQTQQLIGGLFGMGAGLLSDERAKENIKPVGELKGHKLYEYDYKGKFDDGKKHIGVMAQEVEKTRPDAVGRRPDGLREVKYGELFGVPA